MSVDGRGSREAGFTIVEALVAFVILVLVGGGLYAAFGGGAENAARIDLHERAALVARNALERSGPREIETLGTVEVEEPGGFLTRMTVSVSTEGPSSPLIEVRRIDVVVFGPGPERPEMARFSTYRLYSKVSR